MRLTDEKLVLFPVELTDVFVDIPAINNNEPQTVRYAGHQAVVNCRTGRPLAVVSNNYRIVTNQQAIDYGKQCVHTLLESVDPKNISIFNIIVPRTGSYCYIDLIHDGYQVNIWGQEVYVPYLRIANSYNRSRSLRFLIGFCRKVCENGMIFETEAVEFSFAHTKAQCMDIKFNIKKGRMKELEARFTLYMLKVKGISVAPEHAFGIFCKAMGQTFDIAADTMKERRECETIRLKAFRKRVQPLIDKYSKEMGENAYAVFNAMTDFASNTPTNDMQEALQVHSRQRNAGLWLQEITALADGPDFKWSDYLKDYLAYGNAGLN